MIILIAIIYKTGSCDMTDTTSATASSNFEEHAISYTDYGAEKEKQRQAEEYEWDEDFQDRKPFVRLKDHAGSQINTKPIGVDKRKLPRKNLNFKR